MTFGLVLAGAGTPLVAHHAFSAEFDADRPVDMRGKVTRVQWINPHVWVHMEVKMPDGSLQTWAFEAGTPNNLFRRGFTRDMLKPGTELHIDGYQAKDGSRRANGRNMTFADGTMLFMGSSGTGAPYELVPDHLKKGTGQGGVGAKPRPNQ
ncbi:MAG: hypothetical protein FJW23_10660 [Acidimicrobiia bacterium]|nr:hypothetical protein [Acidimicrobiia bacterium]